MEVGSVLPSDVLTDIFKYLPLSDRKNVRLTCHLWNYFCNHPNIIQHEKFVFHPSITGGDENRIEEYLANCRTLRSNFEFYALVETRIPSIVWNKYGDRITSLFLNKCALDSETMKNIFLYCPNLISLRIVSLDLRNIHYDEIPYLFDLIGTTFDYLIRLEVRRESLKSFELFICKPMRDEEIKKLFQIYPKIQTFRNETYNFLTLSTIGREWSICSGFKNTKYVYYYPPEELLRAVPIENFAFDCWKDDTERLGMKFKELEFAVDPRTLMTVNSLTDFLLNQTKLVKLSLHISYFGSGGHRVVTFLFWILKNLTELKILKFYYESRIEFVVREFIEFSKLISNLEYLDISPIHVCEPLQRRLLSSSPSSKFINLKNLHLESPDERVVLQILKRCTSLSTLFLIIANDQILQTIFEHHTELKKLDFVYGFDSWTRDMERIHGMLSGEDEDDRLLKRESYGCLMSLMCNQQPEIYSLARLQNLESLVLRTSYVKYLRGYRQAPKNILMFNPYLFDLYLPRLKHFELDVNGLYAQREHRLLEKLSAKSPYLESLVIRPREDRWNSSQIIQLCKGIKRLKYVKFASNYLTRTDYEHLFMECPSLMKISATNQYYYEPDITYFYDRISKTLISASLEMYG